MASIDWNRLEELFEEALEAPTHERQALVARVSESDAVMGGELQRLLQHESTSATRLDALAERISGLSPTAEAGTLVGRRIKHYDIEGVLGAGGMGVVYRASDTILGRPVAIKFMPPELRAREASRIRFIQEARAASALDHPHICTVYEVDVTEEGLPFIAMACYDGETIEVGHPWAPQEAVRVARHVCSGLAAAHDKGIVHRDIKPGNLFRTREGATKILDFGIAKVLADPGLTRAGAQVGTAAYMSPEQTEGKDVDGRTDIWSLGVVLYEMLAGRRPFPGEYPQAVLYAIRNDAPDPLTGDVPPELARIVMRCLEKDPARRYAHARELGADLATWMGDGIQKVRPRRNWPYAAAAVVALVAAVFWIFRPRGPVTLLVTPFTDNTPGNTHEAMAWGVANDLALTLRSLESVVVKRAQAPVEDYAAAARRYDVDYVLAGTIQGEQDRLRIFPELIDARTATLVFAFPFERSPDSPLAVQREIAQAILDTLRLQLEGAESSKWARESTHSVQAADALARGRYFLNLRTPAALMEAVPALREAISLDSAYADAWAELAHATALLGGTGYTADQGPIAFEQAYALAEHALRLDSLSAVAHMTLGYLEHEWRWNWFASERAFVRSLDIDPENAIAHHLYATHLAELGELRAALRHIREAGDLDPESAIIRANHGMILLLSRQYAEADAVLSELLDRDRSFYVAFLNRALVHTMQGRHRDADRDLHSARALVGDVSLIAALDVTNHIMAGDENAEEALAALLARREAGEYVPAALLASSFVARGDLDGALDWLERGLAEHDVYMTLLSVWPMSDPLRSTPRFRAIMKTMGLED